MIDDLDNEGCTCLDGYPCGCLSPSLCICDDPDPEVQDLLGRIQALETGSDTRG